MSQRRDDDERDIRAALNQLVRMGLVEVLFDDQTGEDRYSPTTWGRIKCTRPQRFPAGKSEPGAAGQGVE
jgi:hypothetical protein